MFLVHPLSGFGLRLNPGDLNGTLQQVVQIRLTSFLFLRCSVSHYQGIPVIMTNRLKVL